METEFIIEGGAELQRQIHALQGNVAGRVLRRAMNTAARLLRDEIRQVLRARGYSLETERAVIVQNQRNPGPTTVRVWVGVTTDAFYLKFIELDVRSYRVFAEPGGVLGYKIDDEWQIFGPVVDIDARPAEPFLRPAFDQKTNEIMERFSEIVQQLIIEQVNRN